jgi:hypothetical protein
MEPEGSSPHSQEPATYPYLEPDKSSPCPHPAAWRPVLILSSHLCLGLPIDLLISGFRTKCLCSPLTSRDVLHALPISMLWVILKCALNLLPLGCVDRSNFARDRYQWRSLVNVIVNFHILLKKDSFLAGWASYSFWSIDWIQWLTQGGCLHQLQMRDFCI